MSFSSNVWKLSQKPINHISLKEKTKHNRICIVFSWYYNCIVSQLTPYERTLFSQYPLIPLIHPRLDFWCNTFPRNQNFRITAYSKIFTLINTKTWMCLWQTMCRAEFQMTVSTISNYNGSSFFTVTIFTSIFLLYHYIERPKGQNDNRIYIEYILIQQSQKSF